MLFPTALAGSYPQPRRLIDRRARSVETPGVAANRIRQALSYVNASDVLIAPDGGMKYLHTAMAFGKLRATFSGARMVRAQLE